MDWSPWEVLSLAFLQAAGICGSDKYCIKITDKRTYRKVPRFSDARKLCCQPKFHTTGPNLRILHQKDANGKANSEDPDQTAPAV